MSETPKRRRLTDGQVAPFWEKVGLATRGQASGAGMVLEWDHMQAREDRKRLAEALQRRVNDCCISARRCLWCLQDLALLAKVDAEVDT